LHDSIGQSLALAKLKLSLVQEIAARLGEQTAEAEVAEIRELVEHSIQDTRSLTFDLSPPVLHQLGFVASIEWLLNEMRNRHKISFIFKNDGTQKSLDDEHGVFLFHAVREVLHNAVKHAGASEVVVSLLTCRGNIVAEIKDDGAGFDTAALNPQVEYQGGYGLFNIRERTSHFGGEFKIESSKGNGTLITISMPARRGQPQPGSQQHTTEFSTKEMNA
jgi:signal transduction histidine kinase